MKAVYDALLCAPGMEDTVKVDLRLTRKVVLFLANAIEKGLANKGQAHDLLALSNEVSPAELMEISSGILERAGLSGMNQKLRALSSAK